MSLIHHECELERHIVEQLEANGWKVGNPAAYDKARALYPEDVVTWLKSSQEAAWKKLESLNGGNSEKTVLDRLVKVLDAKDGGTVVVLRDGFQLAGAGTLKMSESLPEDDRNDTVAQRYACNILRVVPQVRYSLDNENAIDLVFFVNGIPVATVELKTDFTQSVFAAIKQYKEDRTPKSKTSGRAEPLLTFKRGAVVHFAMSDSLIYMTTKLAGDSTFFLPFNRGNDGAAGNPPGEPGLDGKPTYPVSYFWTRVLQKDNWLRIFHRFVLLEKKEDKDAKGNTNIRESLIFPRFHQWEAVTKMLGAVRAEGVGQPYCIQHSAGSGKTNTIAWTAHSLIRVRHPDGEPYFHSVVVVTDRTVLDKQLQDAITQIEHQSGVVKAVDRETSNLSKSQQLAKAMLDGTPIIVCTLQTFPYAQKVILEEKSLRDRRFAVVIDEAHSSTGGSTADDLRYVLTGQSEDEWEKLSKEEKLSVWQSSRQRPGNASYFAFTATPKHSTLMLFGRPKNPGLPVSKENPPIPFHLYTMQQAIEEGFILDVLKNYTSYKVAYRLGSELATAAHERVDETSGKRSLAKWMSLHPTNVGQKVQLITEHFRTNVAKLLNGQAKAMVVTSSRASAVAYKRSFKAYCESLGYTNLHAMVAFSGDVPNLDKQTSVLIDDTLEADHQFNEINMNPDLRGRDMRKAFDTSEFQVMIVANKFQTGFDQPKLVAMYVDKKISGVEAVQTLSRLNRTYPGKDKTYVIDFVNEPEEILSAFKTYYRDAQVSDVQDFNVVYDLKQKLDAMHLYEPNEVERFADAIVDKNVTHERLFTLTQPATDRFNMKLDELTKAIDHWDKVWEQAEADGNEVGRKEADAHRAEASTERDELLVFSSSLSKFVRNYEYIAQLIDFGDPDLEAFAGFARLLRKRLRGVGADQIDLEGLKLTHFRLKKDKALEGVGPDGESPTLDPITDNGMREGRDRQKAYLEELVEKLNNAFGNDMSDKDKVALAVHVSEKLRDDKQVMAQVENNTREEAMKANLPQAAVQIIVQAMQSHQALAHKLLSDEASRGLFLDVVYDLLKKDSGGDLIRAIR
ncbi:type I restriction endonuclease subunit R [Burkholderia vietnamiensis]|uniref:type I restriction endonuclease subunit R n=1 Tax=Burkholderia vietnamiensis TaxID=60552 RepID=UPI001B96DAE1|nr:DEAD/DEAH box helicase family protein [Burkholderia vietnamiensis]MBR8219578.1 type I restriction endonuclease subunit R [Burkholderia vietnamiensis]